jgi:hypothetical protein
MADPSLAHLEPLAADLIVAEHAYIAQTAFQANEDRARASQYFFVTFATFAAAVLSTQVNGPDPVPLYVAFTVIFCLLSVLGLLTVLELVRLRQAWLESIRAMNQIKAEMVKNHPDLARYFRWTAETVPPAFKSSSFGFLQAISVALLSGLALGAAVSFGSLAAGAAQVPWLLAVPFGLAAAAAILYFGYVRPLRRTIGGSSGPEAQARR